MGGFFDDLMPAKPEEKPAGQGYGAFSELVPKKPLLQRAYDSVSGVIRGDATEDLPNVNEAGMGGGKVAMASMMGGDEDYAAALEREGYKIEQDENGNAIAVGPDGKRAYINQPGLDMEDVVRMGGKVLSFLPSAKVASLAPGLIGKATAGGAAALATDAGMQKAAGRENIDPVQGMVAGGAGMFAELAAPILQNISKLLPKGRAPTPDQGRAVMREMGLSDNVADDVAMSYAQLARQHIDAKVRPEARVADAEFGLNPDPSQQVDDYWRTRDIAAESTGGRAAQNEQILAAEQAGLDIGEQLGGQAPGEAADVTMRGVQQTAKARAQEVDDAYRAVDTMDGSVQGGAFDDLFQRINTFADDNYLRGKHNAPVYPGSQSILGNMDELAEQVARLRADPSVQGFNAPFKAVEGFRRAINAAVGSAKSSDMRAAKALQKEFDGWIDDVFDRGLVNGDEAFLGAQKEARALYAKYKHDFAERWLKKGSDSFGKKMESFTDGQTSPEEMADFVFGVADRIKPDTAREFAKRMRGVLAPEDFNAFRQAAFEKNILKSYTKDASGLRAISNNIKASITGKNNRLFSEILTAEERELVKRYGMAIDGLLPGSPIARKQAASSGTAERLIGAVLSRLEGVPIVGILPKLHNLAIGRQYAKPGLLQQPKVNPAGALLPGMVQQ